MKLVTIIFLLLITISLFSQNSTKIVPFKGFHLGITYQGEWVQKCKMVPLMGDYEYPPIPVSTFAWELGLEMSYHFAKYFGVSLGLNYGAIYSVNYKYHMTEGLQLYDGYDPYISQGKYEKIFVGSSNLKELVFPIKLEFHFPLCRNLYFTADIGIKIKGLENFLIYEKGDYGVVASDVSVQTAPATIDSIIHYTVFFDVYSEYALSAINVDLLIGAGLYYKLPFGDLLRFTTGVNVAFKDYAKGYYVYRFHNTYGSFSTRHNFLYAQLSYIHTFNYEKAKRLLKINRLNFETKKDKRRYIFQMLK